MVTSRRRPTAAQDSCRSVDSFYWSVDSFYWDTSLQSTNLATDESLRYVRFTLDTRTSDPTCFIWFLFRSVFGFWDLGRPPFGWSNASLGRSWWWFFVVVLKGSWKVQIWDFHPKVHSKIWCLNLKLLYPRICSLRNLGPSWCERKRVMNGANGNLNDHQFPSNNRGASDLELFFPQVSFEKHI